MAGPYPLATLSFTITAAGISAPSFADILASLQASYQAIFGQDVYLDPDSQDGQWLAVIANAINDVNQQAIALYNSFSPTFAVGAGLSSLVKINAIRRNVPSPSTVVLAVTGQPGTEIVDGIVGDNQNLNTQWALPPVVVIPGGGSINVTATCTQLGAFSAAAGTLINIVTPTAGWQSVTNAAPASPGLPFETDAALRARQTLSTSFPALTPIGAIVAAIAAVPGVSRSIVYENDTAGTDGNGVPSHSISAVVQGGDVTAVATAIEEKKSPGTGTFGTTSVVVNDPQGVPITINFFELALTRIYLNVTLTRRAGFVGTTAALVQEALSQFVSTLAIGGTIYYTRLFTPANLEGSAAQLATGLSQAQLEALGATYDITALTVGTAPAPAGVVDVPIAFNAAASLAVADITVTLV